MLWVYQHLARPILFTRDSESAHEQTLDALARVSRNSLMCDVMASFFAAPSLPVRLWGLNFPNPIGLAAGMDKGAAAVPAWAALGFGFSELGGVTWHAQPGNPPPRMFRVPPDEALINRMGFNNPGAETAARRLAEWRASGRWPTHPVGVNLGKSKITPLDKAPEDYAESFRVLWPHADFFVVNVSSPNTPNLRQLQDKSALDEILAALEELNRSMARSAGMGPDTSPKPILVKIAPDLTFDAIDEMLELVGPRSLAGIVATNTTISRPDSSTPGTPKVYEESGGLSGRPLRRRSTEIIRHLHRQTRGSLPLIGVGGVFDAADAWEKITAGASLVQLYTGLVYRGPGVAKAIVTGLQEKLAEVGLDEIHQAVGIHAR